MVRGAAAALTPPIVPDPLPLTVRLARPDDTEAVLAFTRDTFDGWDYVPEVWAGWLAAPDGLVLVAEATDPARAAALGLPEGPLAMARLALLSPDEGWLEGMRVHRAARGLRVATTLQVALLAWTQAQGARVVRFATGETNEGSRRLGARAGFALVGRWRSYQPAEAEAAETKDPAAQSSDRPAHRLRAAGLLLEPDADGLRRWWARVEADPAVHLAAGLYESRAWSWQALTAGRMAAHARAGQVVAAESGDWWALGILAHDDEGVPLADPRFALLAGDETLALRLIEETRRVAGRPVHLRLPEETTLPEGLPEGRARPIGAATLAAAGLVPNERAMVVLEMPLVDAAGRPVPIRTAGAGALTCGDIPARRGLVPPWIG